MSTYLVIILIFKIMIYTYKITMNFIISNLNLKF